MKKYMSLLAAFAAVPILSSCTGGLFPGSDDDDDGKVDLTVRAPRTRAHLDDDIYVVWDVNDKVTVNGVEYMVEPDSENPGSATIRDVDKADSYMAFYCGSSSVFDEGTRYVYEIPQYQAYMSGSFGAGFNPMVAYGTSDKLQFNNLNGILKVGVTGDGENVRSISLTGNAGEQLYGSRIISKEDIEYGSFNAGGWYRMTDYETSIEMQLEGENVRLSHNPVWFYFSLPPMTFEQGFSVSVADMNGNVFSQSTDSKVAVERSKVTEIECFAEPAPSDGLSISFISATHNSITCEITGAPGSVVNAGLVYSRYKELLVRDFDFVDKDAIDCLVRYYSEGIVLDGGGKAVRTFASTEAVEETRHLASDTEYFLFAGYVSGETVSDAFTATACTEPAVGIAPALEVRNISITHDNASFMIHAPNAAYAYYCYMSYDEYLRALNEEGQTDQDIINYWTRRVSQEELDAVRSDGLIVCKEEWDKWKPDSVYFLWVTVTSEGGVEEHVKIDFRTLEAPEVPEGGIRTEDFEKDKWTGSWN